MKGLWPILLAAILVDVLLGWWMWHDPVAFFSVVMLLVVVSAIVFCMKEKP